MVNWTGDVADNDNDGGEEETETEPETETEEVERGGEGESPADESEAETTTDESEGSKSLVDSMIEEAQSEGSDDTSDEDESEAVEDDEDVNLDEDVEAEAEELVEQMESEEDESEDSDVSSAIAEVADDVSGGSDDKDDESPMAEKEIAQEGSESLQSAGSSGSLIDQSMISDIAPSAVSREVAASQEPRWTFLVWGDEGTGKSHFAHTAPEPICYLDTEGKASNLASKFDKEVVYFDATDYDAARESLIQALDLLGKVREEHGVIGTIVVDSMSKLWEFAQQKHVDEHYVTKESPEDVTFKSGLQGGDDWKKIKKYHNARFRDVLADCDFHVVLTAMAEEDYNAVMEGAEGKPMKPQGEKNNKYAVENIVRLRSGPSGDTVGDLLKTDRTRLRFRGLEWPTFDDAIDFIQRISKQEQSEGSVDVDDWPVDIVRGSPDTTANPEGDSDD
mgnify:CR=1 FL=1